MDNEHTVKSYDDDLELMSAKVVEMGSAAVEQLRATISSMKAGTDSCTAKVAAESKKVESVVDEMQVDLDHFIVNLLATRQPMATDLRRTMAGLRIGTDLEQLTDYMADLSFHVPTLCEHVPASIQSKLIEMGECLAEMLVEVLDAYSDNDVKKARNAYDRDDELDAMYHNLMRDIRTASANSVDAADFCAKALFVGRYLERGGDIVESIANEISYIILGKAFNGDTA